MVLSPFGAAVKRLLPFLMGVCKLLGEESHRRRGVGRIARHWKWEGESQREGFGELGGSGGRNEVDEEMAEGKEAGGERERQRVQGRSTEVWREVRGGEKKGQGVQEGCGGSIPA